MSKTNIIGCLVLVALVIAGCRGAVKESSIPDYRMEIIRLNNTAEKAYRKGNYERALVLYEEALRKSRSVEDVESIAVNLINLSLVHRKLGNVQEALRYVDQILKSDDVEFSAIQKARATEIKASLHIDEGRLEKAMLLADEVMSNCRSLGCDWEGRLHNLRARIYFLQGSYEAALDEATRGREVNATKDRTEMANSLRIIADAMNETGRYSEARNLYEEALTTDKELGLTAKIAADLRGLGRVHIGLKENATALEYFSRAVEVSKAGGDEEGRSDAEKMIELLLENQ